MSPELVEISLVLVKISAGLVPTTLFILASASSSLATPTLFIIVSVTLAVMFAEFDPIPASLLAMMALLEQME